MLICLGSGPVDTSTPTDPDPPGSHGRQPGSLQPTQVGHDHMCPSVTPASLQEQGVNEPSRSD